VPLYVYKCPKCGKTIEIMCGMEDDTAHLCTDCKENMDKVVTGTSFRLKGAGWPGKDIKEGGG
jgi:putative FmdB family regulatory protein